MSSDRRAVEVARRLDLEQAGRRAVSSGDPYMAGWAGQLHRGAVGPRLEYGVVTDVVPGAHLYRVSAGPRSTVYCTAAGPDAGFGVIGVRAAHTFAPLTQVYFVRDPEAPDLGVIVAAVPHWTAHTGAQPADALWPFTRTGFGVESAHRYPIESQARAAAALGTPLAGVEGADASAGRPFDGTAAGEWWRLTETGLRIGMDPFHVQIGRGAYGYTYFGEDELTRLATHHYQFVSILEEREHLDDAGELYGHGRGCVYPWEAYGLWRFNQVTPGWAAGSVPNIGLAGGQGQQLTDPYAAAAGSGYAAREPEDPGQLAAARVLDWSGYLGQGGHLTVALPVQLNWAYPSVPAGAATAAVGYCAKSMAPGFAFELSKPAK
jgi:hypothetical protein